MIKEYICSECIILDMNEHSKDGVIARLAKAASKGLPNASVADIIKVIKEREELSTTGVGEGIAIPHAKLEGLEEMIIVVARSIKGVPFEAVDHKPVHVIFLLLAPNDSTIQYLKMLANISRILRREKVGERILEATKEEEIKSAIEQAEEKIRSGDI